MRHYTKGEAKTLCRKMPPLPFCEFKHQFELVKRLLELECCGEARAALHRLSWLLWGQGGGFGCNHNTRSPWSSLTLPPLHHCSLSGGGRERLDIWQGVV